MEATDTVDISDITSSFCESGEGISEISTSLKCAKIYSPSMCQKELTRSLQVVGAANRHKLFSSALNDVLAALIKDSGCYVNDFIMSASTTRRAGQTARGNKLQITINTF